MLCSNSGWGIEVHVDCPRGDLGHRSQGQAGWATSRE